MSAMRASDQDDQQGERRDGTSDLGIMTLTIIKKFQKALSGEFWQHIDLPSHVPALPVQAAVRLVMR